MSMLLHVGTDVHKDTNSVCIFDAAANKVISEYTIPAGVDPMVKSLKKVSKNLGDPEIKFVIGYEAGPTGYVLCKDLKARGYECHILAPTTIQKASGERVKTDRKDALKIAKALAYGGAKTVHLLDDEDEAVRDLTRARSAVKKMLKKSKQILLSFLLRYGYTYSGTPWTQKFWRWIAGIKFSDRRLQLAFETYCSEVSHFTEVVANLDAEIEQVALTPRYKENVAKLVCIGGIDTHTALSLLCEIGDFTRFRKPGEFAAYVGIVPGQDSSGQRTRYTGVTKTGNSRVRILLTESVKAIKSVNIINKSKARIERQRGQDPLVIAYADRATKRIKNMMIRLQLRGKDKNVATMAGARELANFIWGMMNDMIV